MIVPAHCPWPSEQALREGNGSGKSQEGAPPWALGAARMALGCIIAMVRDLGDGWGRRASYRTWYVEGGDDHAIR